MPLDRRTGASVALALLLVTSGCIGFLTGEEALSFEATPATVAESALSETGYEHNGTRSLVVNRTFEQAGQSREVRVTNHLAEYHRDADLAVVERRVAVFVVLSSPQVNVLGRTFNPIGELSNRELLDRLQSRYGRIDIGATVGSETVSTLGTEATVETFEATARVQGTDLDAFVHVTKVEHDGDFVVAIGVYPRQLPDEEGRILTLVRNLRHGS